MLPAFDAMRLRRGKPPAWWAVPLGVLLLVSTSGGDVVAQGQGRGGGARGAGGAPPTARASAPKDFTGYWVAVVTEHWHLRMEMPPKNDFSMLPVNAEARRLAGAWTPWSRSAA